MGNYIKRVNASKVGKNIQIMFLLVLGLTIASLNKLGNSKQYDLITHNAPDILIDGYIRAPRILRNDCM